MRGLAARVYALRACEDGVLLYPVYALLFADAGLSAAQISSLFVIWSVVGFVLEIPSGVWADTYSRRKLLALSGVVRAAGFAAWVLWPGYPAFAAGFLLWGVSGALYSGTMQALVYDELAAHQAAHRYAHVMGRGEAVSLVAMLAASALAAPAYAFGGYPLLGAGSVLVSLAYAAVALSLPETPPLDNPDDEDDDDGADDEGGYLDTLRAGLRQLRGKKLIRRAVVIAALVPVMSALDEYLPLLAREMGTSTVDVPLLLLLPTAAMAAAGALAGRWSMASARGVAVAIAAGAVLLGVGSAIDHPAGMLPVAGFFAVMQVSMVLADARLQESITGRARATVTSVAGVGTEVATISVYLAFAAGSGLASVATLMGLSALPIAALAILVARWLPPVLSRQPRSGDSSAPRS